MALVALIPSYKPWNTCVLSSKWSILSRTTKKDEEASSYRLTTVHGGYHGLTVVLASSEFFCSSLAPWA